METLQQESIEAVTRKLDAITSETLTLEWMRGTQVTY